MSKDFKEINEQELENVNGGTHVPTSDMDLVYRGEAVDAKNLVFAGDKKKAIKLGGKKKSGVDGKEIVGDFTDKATFC